MLGTQTKRRIDTARDFKAVPAKYRTLVPEYVKDYVSLNQFVAWEYREQRCEINH